MIETNVIICGDCIEEMKKIPTNSVDLIFADPPYWMRVEGTLTRVEGTKYDGCNDTWDNQFKNNNDYNTFTKNWLVQCQRILKQSGSIWVIGGMQCIYSIGFIMQDLGFWFINDVIWHKKNPTPNFKGTRLNNSHETLIWAMKSEKSKYTFNYKTAKELNTDTVTEVEFKKGTRKQLGSVWRIGICQGNERIKDKNGEKLHSTQKPEELLRRVIAISSKLGDTVFDPFGGTMTTATVAKKMGRKYITIEREKKYCKYGQDRINNATTNISDIENATFDIKPPKATMVDMIKKGYFKCNEAFFLKDKTYGGLLLENGKILYKDNPIDMHSLASIIKNSNSDRLNGFKFWYVIRNGKLKSIDEIRDDYRQSL